MAVAPKPEVPTAPPSPRWRGRVSGADRLLVILSDVEMGCGGPSDDFPHSDRLADLMLSYNEGPTADLAVDLVFNGDTFDLLKAPYQGVFPRHITREVALGKPKNAEVQLSNDVARRMTRTDDFLLYVLGHRHQAEWVSYGDRKILQAGCLRNEYMLLPNGALRAIAKCYVEAYLRAGVPIISHFVELECPPAPEGYLPSSIFDVAPKVSALLASAPDRAAAGAARREQELREEARGGKGRR